jgi:hypothetical protein
MKIAGNVFVFVPNYNPNPHGYGIKRAFFLSLIDNKYLMP